MDNYNGDTEDDAAAVDESYWRCFYSTTELQVSMRIKWMEKMGEHNKL